MKRRLIIVLLSSCLILSGCSNSSSALEIEDSSTEKQEGSDSSESQKGSSNEEDITEELDSTSSSDITIQQQEVYNQDNLVITVTGIKSDELFGPEITMLFENNTDKNLTVQARNTSVNGYIVDTSMSVDIASGKKANDSLTIMSSSLEQCNIDKIGDIEFSFHIFDADDYMSDSIESDIITLHTNLSGTFEQIYDDSGELLYDENGIRIISKGLSTEDSIWGPCLILYVENSSDRLVTIQARDTSVNGFMIQPTMSIDAVPGKVSISQMTFLESDLEDNQIDNIDNIETSLHIFGTDYNEPGIDTDTITISF